MITPSTSGINLQINGDQITYSRSFFHTRKQNSSYPVQKNNECAITTMLVQRINKSKKAKIKQCCTTKLNSTNNLVPQQQRHKYIVGFPLRLLFVPLFLRTNIFKGNPVCRKAHRIVKYLKIKTDESEYRTQGTNVSLS